MNVLDQTNPLNLFATMTSMNASQQLDKSVYSTEAPRQKPRLEERIKKKTSEESLKKDSNDLVMLE